ncbi:hypothetical protein ACYJ1Y_08960 [Natrialbaceae archaeon A-gly3]
MKPTALEIETDHDRDRWKQVIYVLIRWIFRTWMACVALVALFTVLWTLEALDVITGDTLGTIWQSIVAVGIVFLALLIPVFFVTRGQ